MNTQRPPINPPAIQIRSSHARIGRKDVIETAIVTFVVCTIAFLLMGCDTLGNLVTKPVQKVTTVTNTVKEVHIDVRTNFVPVTIQLPGTTTVLTNFETKVIFLTNEVPVTRVETVTNIVYVAKDGIEKGLNVATAGAVFIPPPYGSVATAGLGVLSGALAFLVRRKNGEKESLSSQLKATIQGVESVAEALPDGHGDKIKGAIHDAARILGVADDLHASVKSMTG